MLVVSMKQRGLGLGGINGEISKNDFVPAFHEARDHVDVGPFGIIEYHLPLCSLFLHTDMYILTHINWRPRGGWLCMVWVPSSDIIRGTYRLRHYVFCLDAYNAGLRGPRKYLQGIMRLRFMRNTSSGPSRVVKDA